MERIMDEQPVIVDDHVFNSCDSEEEEEGKEVNSCSPLQDMSSLLLQLPIKRGLSKHYNGKSRSFTSLSNVRCVEDVGKEENRFKKKLKTCKNYGGGFVTKQTSKKGTALNIGSHILISRFNNNYNKNNGKPSIPPARPIDQQVA